MSANDLPVCSLCGQPHVTIGNRDSVYHTSFDGNGCPSTCPLLSADGMTKAQWIKLMAPATAAGSCDGSCKHYRINGPVCIHCSQNEANKYNNYEAAKAGENVT